jgi:hypothetical protein
VYTIQIPHTLGEIKERWDSGSSLASPQVSSPLADSERDSNTPHDLNQKTIIHIQDAHTSFEAQKNVAMILNQLTVSENIPTVFVEGACGVIPVERFRESPLPEVKALIAEEYLRNGLFTGSEFGAIVSPYPYSLVGVEDKALFYRNFRSFRSNQKKKALYAGVLMQIEEALSDIEKRVYSDTVYAFHKDAQSFYAGSLCIEDFMPRLMEHVKTLEIDCMSSPYFMRWQELVRENDAEKIETFLKSNLSFLIDSVQGVSDLVLDALAHSKDEKRFIHYRRLFHMLKMLAANEVRPYYLREYAECLQHTSLDDFENDLVSFGHLECSGVAAILSQLKAEGEAFYSDADKRSILLIENTLKEMASRKHDVGILISGGYHSADITAFLREKKVNYIVITPRVAAGDAQVPFTEKMTGALFPLMPELVSTITGQGLDLAYDPLTLWKDMKREEVSEIIRMILSLSEEFDSSILNDVKQKLFSFIRNSEYRYVASEEVVSNAITSLLAELEREGSPALGRATVEKELEEQSEIERRDEALQIAHHLKNMLMHFYTYDIEKETPVHGAMLPVDGESVKEDGTSHIVPLSGKVFTHSTIADDEWCIASSIDLKREGDLLTLQSKDGTPLFDKKGNHIDQLKIVREIEGEELSTYRGRLRNIILQADYKSDDSVIAKLINAKIEDLQIVLFEDPFQVVRGVPGTNGEIYIERSIFEGPDVLQYLFHEIGESLSDEIEEITGVQTHTYLRGCGKDVRSLDILYEKIIYIEDLIWQLMQGLPEGRLTSAEIDFLHYNWRRGLRGRQVIWGLQDHIFRNARIDINPKTITKAERAALITSQVAEPIVYFPAIGADDKSIDLKAVLVHTDGTHIVGTAPTRVTNNSQLNFNIFKVFMKESVEAIDIPLDDVDFQVIDDFVYQARFVFQGKERLFRIYYGYDAFEKYPAELRKGYNVLYFDEPANLLEAMNPEVRDELLALLEEDAGFIFLRGRSLTQKVRELLDIDFSELAADRRPTGRGGIGYRLYQYGVMKSDAVDSPAVKVIEKESVQESALSHLSDEKINMIKELLIGDIHCEYDELVKLLKKARYIDENLTWIAGERRLISLGDVPDYGDPSGARKVWDLLEKLQKEAREVGGEVVRLLGNHELLYLERYFEKKSRAEKIGMDVGKGVYWHNKIANAVKRGELVAACEVNGHIVVHGGVVPELAAGRTIHELVEDFNWILNASVNAWNYNDKIFFKGKSRGFTGDFAGIFWATFSIDIAPRVDDVVPQYTAHEESSDGQIRSAGENNHVVCLDVGFRKGADAWCILEEEEELYPLFSEDKMTADTGADYLAEHREISQIISTLLLPEVTNRFERVLRDAKEYVFDHSMRLVITERVRSHPWFE